MHKQMVKCEIILLFFLIFFFLAFVYLHFYLLTFLKFAVTWSDVTSPPICDLLLHMTTWLFLIIYRYDFPFGATIKHAYTYYLYPFFPKEH